MTGKVIEVQGRLINSSFFVKETYKDSKGREGTPAYKIELALEDTDAVMVPIEDAIAEVVEEKWGKKAVNEFFEGEMKSPLLSGDALADDREQRGKRGDAYRGNIIIRANTIYNYNGEDADGGIWVCDEDAVQITAASGRSKIYNGCYVKANLKVEAYDGVGGGKDGVTFYLNGVQKIDDGEPLRGNDPASMFQPLAAPKKGEGEGRRSRS